jgi:hypothetical protein
MFIDNSSRRVYYINLYFNWRRSRLILLGIIYRRSI